MDKTTETQGHNKLKRESDYGRIIHCVRLSIIMGIEFDTVRIETQRHTMLEK